MKTCSECRQTLPKENFHKNIRRTDGYHEYCKDCRKAQYLRRDQESAVARAANRYATKRKECLEKMHIRYTLIADQKRAYSKSHYTKNKNLYVSNAALRKDRIKRCTPIWFDEVHKFVFQEAYRLAKLRESMLHIQWDVDHIIPIKGKLVCGLNVMQNIAVIPRKENNFKRAKF